MASKKEEAGTGDQQSGTQQSSAIPGLEEMQHWTLIMGRAQQMLMQAWADALPKDKPFPTFPATSSAADPLALMNAGVEAWTKGLESWGKLISPRENEGKPAAGSDRRFSHPEWRENPVFDTIRQTYLSISDRMLGTVDDIADLDPDTRQKLRFAVQTFVDAMSPSNFALTNPQVLQRTFETRGENLLNGLKNMLQDIQQGQLTQSKSGAFEVGSNIAATPGKVIHETPLYQLIQYTPTTDKVLKTPLVIFPPWINRFYILDLSPEKSLVRWCVDHGVSLFMVSWKSADESSANTRLADYVLRGQVDAIDTVRDLLGVESVHTIGYCVAGSTLAATLAVLAERGQADKVKSATMFTAQVDFTKAGDLKLFLSDETMGLLSQLTAEKGFLDGRYMAATFNLLRGRDLIWSYVINNYLMGEEPAPFDLLHWNSDFTNLPASWHREYLEQFYRDNLLAKPGGITIEGTPVDLSKVKTPMFIQAGSEDHIAPPESVWKAMDHFGGPRQFLLAGSGHIAGVVNPPSAKKYGFWTNDDSPQSLEEFVAGATEHKGSWWEYWLDWLRSHDPEEVGVEGARIPGQGKLKTIEDAPGRYVKSR